MDGSHYGDQLSALAGYLSVGRRLEDDELLRMMMDVGVALVRGDEGSMLLLDRETRELVFRMTVGSEESEQELIGQRVPLDEGIVGLVASTGEPQAGAPRHHDVQMFDQEPAAVLAAPIAVGEEVIGVLTAVRFASGETFGVEELQTYTQFGRMCGLLLEQRVREDAIAAVLRGDEHAALEDALRQPLARGPLGDEQRLVASIVQNIVGIARDRTQVLELCEELTGVLLRISRTLTGPS